MRQNQKHDELDEILRCYPRDMLSYTVELAKRYLAKHPDNEFPWPFWCIYGESLRKMGRYSEALAALRRAQRFCPRHKRYSVYRDFGHLHKRRGAFRLAERWYRKVTAANPSDSSGYIHLGALLAAAGRLREAESAFRRATKCKEGCRDEAFLDLGMVLCALDKYPEARRCFQQALKIDPKYKAAHKGLSDVEHLLKKRRNT